MRIIAGTWRGRRLAAPKGRDVRPTTDRVREAWMSALGGDLTGIRVLDLFAGSGALGLEALSRGAAEVVFVEKARPSLRALRANIRTLGCDGRTTVVPADVFKYLLTVPDRAFDLALADPPYGRDLATALLREYTRKPFADELWVEHSSREAVEGLAGATSRSYGNTMLTTLVAPALPEVKP